MSFRLASFVARFSSSHLTFNRFAGTMSKPKVFVSRPDVPEMALALLREKCELTLWKEPKPCPRDYFLENIKGVDGIFCLHTDKVNQEVLDAAGSNLKVVATMSVGHEHIDVNAMKAAGVKVGYTPDVLTDAVAEVTIGILLAAARRFFEGNQELQNGGWLNCNWGPLYLCGQGLTGATVGIYGFGRIGQAVMERLIPFKPARFIYGGRTEKPEIKDAQFVDFDTLMRESDFIIVCCSLNADTKELFDKRAFALMKPNAVFVNTSRGGVVQQEDLIDALKENKIFAAGLDVMTPEPLPLDHELAKLKNCALIPHLGSATVKTRTDMALLTARNVLGGLGVDGNEMPAQLC